jgi:hypothetical protein
MNHPLRGRRLSLATTLAQTLANKPEALQAAVNAAFSEACGWSLARAGTVRRLRADGRLTVDSPNSEWGAQLAALSEVICRKVNARLGRPVARQMDVVVGERQPTYRGRRRPA